MKEPLFLKRDVYNAEKDGYEFSDGSGFVPREMKIDAENALIHTDTIGMDKGRWAYVWGTIFAWKDRLNKN